MAANDQILAIIWMQQRLDLLDRAILKLRQLRNAATTDADKRSVDGRLAELNMAFAHAKAQYEVAKLGASQLKPPDEPKARRIMELADRVQKLVATDQAIHDGLRITGEVFDLMKELAA